MSTAELNPRPVRVSPLIKASRWTLLTAGIIYGFVHNKRLSKSEAEFRVVEAKKKVIRDKKLAEEKSIAAAKEIKDLMDSMK